MEDTFPHYRFKEELLDFGPGLWHRAEDLRTGQDVAIGVFEMTRKELQGDDSNPVFLPVLEQGKAPDGRAYMVTQLNAGSTLQARLGQRPITAKESIEIARSISAGLQRLHSSGESYGTLNSESIQLSPSGGPRLFPAGVQGEIRPLDPSQAPETPAFHRGTVQGDIWALGVVLYSMVAGQPPFAQKDPADLAFAIRFEQPPSLRSQRRGIPAGLERVIALALAKRPEHRYQSMGDLLTDLEAVARGRQPVVATPFRIALAAKRTRRGSTGGRFPALLRPIMIFLGVVLAGLITYWLIQGEAPWVQLGTARDHVAVMPFHDLTYRPEASDWAFVVQRRIAAELGGCETITLMDSDSLNAYVRARVGSAQARRGRWLFKLLEELDVGYFVDGGIFWDGERFLLRGQVFQQWSAEVLMTDTAQFSGGVDVQAAAGRLGTTIRSFLETDRRASQAK